MKRMVLLLLFCGNLFVLQGQVDSLNVPVEDTIPSIGAQDTILIDQKQETFSDTIDLALSYLKEIYLDTNQWVTPDDSLRMAIGRLITYVEHGPIGTAVDFLRAYPFDLLTEPAVGVKSEYKPAVTGEDTLYLPFVQDTLKTDSLILPVDTIQVQEQDTIPKELMDSIYFAPPDSISYLELQVPQTDTLQIIFTDSTQLIFQDTILFEISDSLLSPLKDFTRIGSADSLKNSIALLLDYIEDDSLQLWIKNLANDSTSIWLSDKIDYRRFWLKNEVYDSIGIWIQADDKNSLKFIVDDGVYFRKMGRSRKTEDYLNAEQIIESTLQEMKPIEIKPQIWKYGGVGAFNFAQGYLSNWAKGGESSISTFTEINLFGNYSKNNTKWDNTLRFKYGLIKSGDKRLRKNEDLLEINSKFGQKAFGKLGQRAIEKYGTEGIKDWYYSLLVSFKSQIAKGYNYPNDSVVVSRFMAPGYLMFALGLDYKPNDRTSVLISPITSKSTYVLDTALIDQTKYGIAANKKVYREIGAYIKTRYLYNFNEDISVENKLDLFTNYTHNPQNIDIDWEVILRMQITFYLSATISTHMIYDDDVLVPIYNNEGVKTGEGPRLQFKELLSIGFSYKF